MSARFPTFVDGLPVTRRALEFAARHHAGHQRGSDHAPFILHPLEVAQMLCGRGYADEVVAAGVLHDVIEDAHVRRSELRERFGEHVATLVCEVSEPSATGTWAERKARLREAVAEADLDAAAIYGADKIAKVRELRIHLATTGTANRARPGAAGALLGVARRARRAPGPPSVREPAALRARSLGNAAACADRSVDPRAFGLRFVRLSGAEKSIA